MVGLFLWLCIFWLHLVVIVGRQSEQILLFCSSTFQYMSGFNVVQEVHKGHHLKPASLPLDKRWQLDWFVWKSGDVCVCGYVRVSEPYIFQWLFNSLPVLRLVEDGSSFLFQKKNNVRWDLPEDKLSDCLPRRDCVVIQRIALVLFRLLMRKYFSNTLPPS